MSDIYYTDKFQKDRIDLIPHDENLVSIIQWLNQLFKHAHFISMNNEILKSFKFP